jgi:hypothetical protein
LLQYSAPPGTQATYTITVFGTLRREWAKRQEDLGIKATLHYLEKVTRGDAINVELECQICGLGQAGNGGNATSSALNLKWPVKMKRSGRDVQIPVLEKYEFPQIPELAVLILFNETTRLLAFAERPVEEGESWTSRLELRTRNATIPVEVSSRFLGCRTYRGFSCAEIESRLKGDLDLAHVDLEGVSVAMKGEQEGALTLLFAPEQGQVVRSEGRLEIELRPEPPAKQEADLGKQSPDIPQTIRLEFQFVRELQKIEVP